MLTALRRRSLAVRNALWALPSAIIVACGGLAVALIRIDRHASFDDTVWAFGGGADAARSVLSTIAASLITVAGLTFSITIVALQLASTQFSPRVLRNFLGDRMTQTTVGSFVGIFLYALVVLRSVRTEDESFTGFVPALSITVAIALAVLALFLLVVFIHHISNLIQVSSTTARIAHDTLTRIDELYPEPFGAGIDASAEDVVAKWEATGGPALVRADRPGFVQGVHLDAVARAFDDRPAGAAIEVAPGDFVTADGVVARVWGVGLDEQREGEVQGAITIADERDLSQDVAFGVRQLADIAIRALSPSLNDPTTAVTCIGYIRSILARLAERAFPPQVRRFPDTPITLAVRRRGFDEHLDAMAEIASHANRDTRVTSALVAALDDIAQAAEQASAGERAELVRELTRRVTRDAAAAPTP